jgi:hypothetical protein
MQVAVMASFLFFEAALSRMTEQGIKWVML